jgi:malate dehydrogenase (oxaloacetate-decarboxylating)
VLAALLNAAKLIERRLEDLRILVLGAGAAGVAITKILLSTGVKR